MHSNPSPPRSPPRSETLLIGPGEPMESARHRQQMEVLVQSLDWAWKDRRDYYAAADMFLYFSETQARKNDFRGPGVLVVLGTDRHERHAWVVWEEDGKTPDVIIELLSESTEHADRGEKMRIYAKLKVGEYFLFDPWSGVFEGYTLDPLHGEYRRKELDASGRAHCAQLGLWLGKAKGVLNDLEMDWLRWMDADGKVLPVPAESAEEAIESLTTMTERAKAEAERADRLKAERDRLEAELAQLRGKSGPE